MRKFNFNAMFAGISMANGQVAFCAKSNLHDVEPDALCLDLCGRSFASTSRSSSYLVSASAGIATSRMFGTDDLTVSTVLRDRMLRMLNRAAETICQTIWQVVQAGNRHLAITTTATVVPVQQPQLPGEQPLELRMR